MSTNHHMILRSRIEVTTDSLTERKLIQQIINKTIERRLAPILEKIFSQHVPDDVVIHLDKLVINVGDLDLRGLKKKLSSQVEKTLATALKAQIAKVVRNPTPDQITPLPEAKLQAIKHYLSEGNFAWWMTEYSERHIEKIYLELFHSEPVLIEKFWHNLPKKEKAIQRCVACFTEATIENTLGFLAKRPANFFTSIIAEIGALLHHTGTLTHLPYTPQKQLLAAALLGLIHQQHPTMDRMSFLAMLLKQVAVKVSTSYENVLESLRSCCEPSALQFTTLSPKTTTKELILALQDLSITPPKFKNKEGKKQEAILKQLDKIGHGTVERYQLSALMDGIKAQLYKPFVRNLVQRWLREKRNRKQLAQKLPDGLFISFIQAIDPAILPIFSNIANILATTTAIMPTALSIKEVTLVCCAFEYPKVVFLEQVKEIFHAFFVQGIVNKQQLKKSLINSKGCYDPALKAMVEQWVSTATVADTDEADVVHSTYDIYEHVWMNKLTSLVQHIGVDDITKDFVHRILLEIQTCPKLGEGHKGDTPALDLAHREKLTQILTQETFPIELQIAKNKLFHLLKRDYVLTTDTDKSSIVRYTHDLHGHIWANKLASLVQHVGVDDITKAFVHDTLLEVFPASSLGKGNEAGMPPLRPEQKERCIQILAQETFPIELQIAKNSLLYLLRKTSTYHTETTHNSSEDIDTASRANQDKETIFTVENVVNFLVNDVLPEYQQVPAYFIAKSLGSVDPQKVGDQLAELCQESTILQKLIQHATEVTLNKLVEALIPFSEKKMLTALEVVVMQSKLLHDTERETAIRLVKKIFITAAIASHPPATETQYIARIIMHLGRHTQLSPMVLCDHLASVAKETHYDHLVEAFTILKNSVSPLGLNTIDEVDLIFLPTHESSAVQLDEESLSIYYHQLLPAIKDLAQNSDLVEGYQAQVAQLVSHHLPMISATLVEHIGTSFAQNIEKTIEDKRKQIIQRWKLFLHTGTLGNYESVAALFKDMMEHPVAFFLEQVVEKTDVRQRLIAHFTHTQLILLVQRYSHAGTEIAGYIQSSYPLWCAAQGATGAHHPTKNMFWDVVLATLPSRAVSFHKSHWIEQTITKLSSALEVTPTTLLQTFNLISKDIYGNAAEEPLVILFNDLQEKNNQDLQKKATQTGYEDPVLEKFYWLLHGGYAAFAERYHTTIHGLENELIQLMENNPSACLKMLKNQDHRGVIARRIVHFFSDNVITKIMALLAKEKHSFVMTYLGLLHHTSHHEAEQLSHLLTWKKEIAIAVIDYLIATSEVNEAQLLQTTLVNACYNRVTMSKIIASIVAAPSSNLAEKNIIVLLKPMVNMLCPEPFSDGDPVVTKGKDRLQAPQERAITTKTIPKKNEFQEKEVRVYTKNTGLVFLWPFLIDFFKQQNLILDNQFISEQAAHNAVYILQYLVTGKLKSPEWQLTFPKILCGLSYDEVLLPYHSIDRAEEEYSVWIGEDQESCANEEKECIQQNSCSENRQEDQQKNLKEATAEMEAIAAASQTMIHTVIKRWTSLEKLNKIAAYEKGITAPLFISYFLSRLGVLLRAAADEITESRPWHLTIMHQAHDDLDLLPPWSMNKVKLPWMQEEIILFWMSA
ncbi:contractile injection system tape measure protein [Cardinium endosymbiont of Tipula unca]|uniref:contractile injection system tape measure protein n=1 Tax=Cardinium endosymbiont of Tipula unca TaxID=3066216 RepID=UPI0030D26E22